MNNFIKVITIIITSIAAVLIIFSLTTVGIFIISILFITFFVLSVISKITGKSLYNTKIIYTTKHNNYNNNNNIYDLSSDEYKVEDKK
ncbi:hypothetical protein [Lawsonia intracellularis]|uniref:hypothetical protein n=1 Tax=Lawsonia intracellularis TaxID=29546 RepID=UPI0011EF5C59|nr:hypothetical protein [Lawsonia intracellularis]KAA0205105.1 hypothetical protein C4K43_01195 [Lawsonia intracellularis]